MSDIVFTVAKGRIATYGSLPAADDSLVLVPIMSVGLVDDVTMATYTSLSALLAGASDEQVTIGRKTLTGVAVVTSGTQVNVNSDDTTWVAASGAPVGALVICYKPDGASLDSDIIPLGKFDFSITPAGTDITVKMPAGGFLRAV